MDLFIDGQTPSECGSLLSWGCESCLATTILCATAVLTSRNDYHFGNFSTMQLQS